MGVDEDVELNLDNPFEIEKRFQDYAMETLKKDLHNGFYQLNRYVYESFSTWGQDERLERVKIVKAFEKKKKIRQ